MHTAGVVVTAGVGGRRRRLACHRRCGFHPPRAPTGVVVPPTSCTPPRCASTHLVHAAGIAATPAPCAPPSPWLPPTSARAAIVPATAEVVRAAKARVAARADAGPGLRLPSALASPPEFVRPPEPFGPSMVSPPSMGPTLKSVDVLPHACKDATAKAVSPSPTVARHDLQNPVSMFRAPGWSSKIPSAGPRTVSGGRNTFGQPTRSARRSSAGSQRRALPARCESGSDD
jgi:hypothetical protein